MTTAIEQSIKARIKNLARERETSFSELWRNLILERFLIRLAHSQFREKFVFKGGALLARYIPLGRETQDLDFLIRNLSNQKAFLEDALNRICKVGIDDSFCYEVRDVKIVRHPHSKYAGAAVVLVAQFGATQTAMRMDLGFGDLVDPIDHELDLLTSSKGPLFESRISLRCYPREFIFAEKLEAIAFLGENNTRMKDFHDLHSLARSGSLIPELLMKAVTLVFDHRSTPLELLPITFDTAALMKLGVQWGLYRRKLKGKRPSLPERIEDVVQAINRFLGLGSLPSAKKSSN